MKWTMKRASTDVRGLFGPQRTCLNVSMNMSVDVLGPQWNVSSSVQYKLKQEYGVGGSLF